VIGKWDILIALTCGPAPEGHARWSTRLLADRFVALGHVEALSRETVRQTLKKTNCSRRLARSMRGSSSAPQCSMIVHGAPSMGAT